jgi:hypothetical protein
MHGVARLKGKGEEGRGPSNGRERKEKRKERKEKGGGGREGDATRKLPERPYRVECTGSRPTSEVKRRRARSALGWGTARPGRMGAGGEGGGGEGVGLRLGCPAHETPSRFKREQQRNDNKKEKGDEKREGEGGKRGGCK